MLLVFPLVVPKPLLVVEDAVHASAVATMTQKITRNIMVDDVGCDGDAAVM